jgi:hypothetical protein
VDERAVTCARRRSPVVGTCEPESSDGLGIAHREVEVPGRHIKGAHSERSAAPALFRRRWPNRCALSGSVRPTGGRPVFMFKASLARPRAGSGSVFRTCSAGDLGFNLRRSRPGAWASPAASERASHEVPECGQAPVAVSLAARSDLGPPRRPMSDPAPTLGLACDAPVLAALAARLPSLPTTSPADHPSSSQRQERAGTLTARGGNRSGTRLENLRDLPLARGQQAA